MLIFSVKLQNDVVTHAGSDQAVRKLVRLQIPKIYIFFFHTLIFFLCFETMGCFLLQNNQMTTIEKSSFYKLGTNNDLTEWKHGPDCE